MSGINLTPNMNVNQATVTAVTPTQATQQTTTRFSQTPPAKQAAEEVNKDESAAPKNEETSHEQIVLERERLEATFQYDKQLHQVIIKLRRVDNGDVVTQFPPEQVVKMLTHLMESLESIDKESIVDSLR